MFVGTSSVQVVAGSAAAPAGPARANPASTATALANPPARLRR